ncbi:MAG: PQQ-binding-like beta-propeller repeat protein [Anaerolineales bacterium]|jgi:outer membrane protein assembly factor BamB|nr:PQQ-binding-like beta-propeller repeat protein [Anaerolineales bacterium]
MTMRKKNLLRLGILLVVLTGCTSSPESVSVPVVQTVHAQPQSAATSQAQVEETSPVWTARLSGSVNTAPLISGDLVIAPTADGVIHAIYAENGSAAWTYSGETKIWDASVNADESKVCAGMEGRQVFCLDAKTGVPLWTATLELEVQSRLALTPDRVFAPTTHAGTGLENDFNAQASLIALNAENGEVIWETVTDNYILRRPVLNGEVLITGGAYQESNKPAGEVATRVYAFNVEDGSVIWKYESGDGLLRWVETNGDVVTFSAATETVYALSLADGQLLWQSNPGYWMQFPVMQDGQIFFGSGDEIFHALNASNGQEAWSHKINISSLNQIGRPILRENVLWLNSVTGEIYALDKNNGERLAYLNTGHSSRVGGAVYGSLYILGDPEGNLYAYAIQ